MWDIGKDSAAKYIHPTQKPVALATHAINSCTEPGDIVLDLFGGSGSTLIACEKTGHLCRMMELDPHYVDIIVKRWQDFTGKQAVHAVTGEPFDALDIQPGDGAGEKTQKAAKDKKTARSA